MHFPGPDRNHSRDGRDLGVPTNALLFARYTSIAQYLGEPVTIGAPAGGRGRRCRRRSTTRAESCKSRHRPPLTPDDAYTVHWPALRGIDTATLGRPFDQSFTAGAQADTSPPKFAGITGVSWDISRADDSCTSSIDQRYVFSLGLGTAVGDASPGSRDWLTLLVFQTSGPTVDGSVPAPVLVERIPPEGQSAQVTTTVGGGVGHICFTAIVRDLTLKTSTSASPVCVDTVKPPFFYGCALAPAGRAGPEPTLPLAGVAACAAALRARRPRGKRAPRPGCASGNCG